MNDPTTVSDSTPLILLAKTGRLGILKELFKMIYIPEAVFNETVSQGKTLNLPDAYIIEKTVGVWIMKTRVTPEVDTEYGFIDTNTRLGRGEMGALKLCKQLNATYFLSDDNEARKTSKILGIKPIGTWGTVIQAYRRDYITKKEALQTIDDLIHAGLGMNLILYKRILFELDNMSTTRG